MAGQPGAAACTETTGGHAQQRRAAGPGVEAWLARRPARARSAPAPAWSRQHLGPHGRRLRSRGRRCSPARRRASSRSRSTCAARTSTAGAHLFAHSPTATAEARRGRGGVRPPACGRSSARTSTDLVDDRGAAARGRAPRRSRSSTRCWAWPSTSRPAGRGSAPAAAGCRGRPSTRSPCGPCTTCTPPSPTCRSSASAACATASRRGRAAAGRRRPRCRSAPRPSPIPSAPRACCEGCESWCGRHESVPSRTIVGAAHG